MNAKNAVRQLLENADVPAATGAPAPEPDELEKRRQRYDKAHASYLELQKLYDRRNALERDLGFSLAWRRALAHIDLDAGDVTQPLLAKAVTSTDALRVPGARSRLLILNYFRRFPNAVVGALRADGTAVFFKDPIASRNGTPVPTYAEFAERLRAAAAAE